LEGEELKSTTLEGNAGTNTPTARNQSAGDESLSRLVDKKASRRQERGETHPVE